MYCSVVGSAVGRRGGISWVVSLCRAENCGGCFMDMLLDIMNSNSNTLVHVFSLLSHRVVGAVAP